MAGLAASGDQRFPSSPPESNLKQLLHDAQSRWLKPSEVCEILNNHHTLCLSEASPVKPTSGSLFLFDRNKLRYFRKDGHNWRKKKDGKTVREAHEKLKAGNKDAIHCYYAHGEENPNFQRRSYWLLEGGYEHIVLVHYREVTEGCRFEASAPTFDSQMQPTHMMYGNSSDYLTPSLISSPSEMVTSSYNSQEAVIEVDSGDEFGNNQLSRERQSQVSVLDIFNTELDLGSTASPGYVAELGAPGVHNMAHTSYVGSTSSDTTIYGVLRSQHEVQFQTSAARQDLPVQGSYNSALEEGLEASTWSTLLESTYEGGNDSGSWIEFSQSQQSSAVKNLEFATSTYHDNLTSRETGQYRGRGGDSGEAWSFDNIENQHESGYAADLQSFGRKSGVQHHMEPNILSGPLKEEQEVQTLNKGLLSPTMSLIMRSIQSDQANLLSTSEASWGAVNYADPETSNFPGQINLSAAVDPLLSQGLSFSIVDFAPEWSYAFEETKVLISGVFLDSAKNYSNIRWSCMFGEIEVPADVLQSGALRCTAPPHKAGRVPFCVTRSDKIACSNIEEFEFRNKLSVSSKKSEADSKLKQQEQVMLLQGRFAKLLLTSEDKACAQEASDDSETMQKQNDKVEMFVVDESIWSQIEALVKSNQHPFHDAQTILVEVFFKSALHQWLQRARSVSLLDKHGLGVLHMAGALGYEWAIAPILSAGVGVNFRDEHGWTALHWAAFCGREKIIALLLAADAAPGALTDPTPTDPTGRTASDLAASSGHNGIAGYLGEAIVTSHLSSLNLHESEMSKVSAAVAGDQAIDTLSEKSTAVDASLGITDYELSLRDSLAAVRNAAQAEARITATFRAYSFLKKREIQDSGLNEFGMLEEEARAFAAAQTSQRAYPGHEKSNLAATQIQCKYRGWKVRSDFLALKRQVVKIQAHVRGHQARKKYKKILWTVGVLDKVILRWRRKGSGLRGFKAEGVEEEDSDDDAYLKDFRRQKEAAFGEAVNRVKMMIQNPEARSQYRRMLEIYQKEKGARLDEDLIIPDDELMGLLG